MPQSFAKAQNDLLSSLFLDSVGNTDRGDNNLSELAKSLVQLAAFFIQEAKDNLDKLHKVSSGKLYDSIKAKNLRMRGTTVSLDVMLEDYYSVIDKGAKYTKLPPIGALEEWVQLNKDKISNVNPSFKVGQETKLKTKKTKKVLSEAEENLRIAFAIAQNLKKYGQEGTNFWTDALKAMKGKQQSIIGKAFALTVISGLKSIKQKNK